MTARELSADECHKVVEPAQFRFRSTDEVAPLSGIASQERALTALAFGLDIRQPRFHVVAVGPPGTGRTFSARSVAKRIAAGRPTPDDVLLLPNPTRPERAHRPLAPARAKGGPSSKRWKSFIPSSSRPSVTPAKGSASSRRAARSSAG